MESGQGDDAPVSASLVLYNNSEKMVNNVLSSIMDSDIDVALYVIDNSPTDVLRRIIPDKVKYIKADNNGYGAANNIAIRESIEKDYKYHLVLNPDILFEENVISDLVSYMENNPVCGLVMPKVLNTDGSVQRLCKFIPSPFNLFGRRFLPSRIFERKNSFFQMDFSNYDTEMEVPYLSGCFMFLRNSALKDVGIFDERFFMYPEDIDLSRRINEKYETKYYPMVHVLHDHAKESFKSKKMLWIHISNLIKYFNKWGWFFDMKRKIQNKKTIVKLKENGILE